MRKSLSALVILGLVLLAPLATLTAPQATAQEPVEITFWFDTIEGVEHRRVHGDQCGRSFNALGNGVTVDATIQANNWDATKTAMAGGAGPDVVEHAGTVVRHAACAGRSARST